VREDQRQLKESYEELRRDRAELKRYTQWCQPKGNRPGPPRNP
jgi:hypothetical protein